ncbi:MAG: YaeQ family protein [Planctomycetes bacterium]|nr:YaeQ family protein [Planctomycetota bacterium]
MSQGERLRRFRIQRTPGGELDLRLAQHASETDEFLVARLLATVAYHGPGFEVSSGVCRGDEPALSRRELDGRLVLWIEIGLPKRDRLDRALRAAEQVVVVAHKRADVFLRELEDDPPRRKERLRVHVLDAATLTRLGKELDRDNRWSIDVEPALLRVRTPKTAHELAFTSAI